MTIRKFLKENTDLILDLYLNQNKSIDEIVKLLNLKYAQPIYNLLNKHSAFQKHKNCNVYRKYHINENYFDIIDDEYKAYILGFIVADGHVSDTSIKIALNIQDIDILYKIRDAMGSTHPIVEFIKDGKYNHCSINLNSMQLCRALRCVGVQSNKSLNMGNIIKYVPDDLKYHFLRGYFDGDGCLTYGAKYSSGTKYLVQIIGTKEFLETSFGAHFETNCKLYKYSTCNMYCWKISKKSQVDNFIIKIYENANIFLNRKYESAKLKSHLIDGKSLIACSTKLV